MILRNSTKGLIGCSKRPTIRLRCLDFSFERQASLMPQKLIIDADPGIGDALAIAVALLDPEIDVIALTAVGGSVSAVHAGRNLQSIVEALDPPKWPRIGVADSGQRFQAAEVDEVDSPAWLQLQQNLNGVEGLGDWTAGIADLHNPKDAAKLMIELSRQYPHEIMLLTLGPLSNIALACDRDSEFLNRLKGIVCLAGAVTSPGDVAPVSEFNVKHHPEAARMVLRFPTTKTLVPLDVSQRPMLTFEHFQRYQLKDETRCGHFLRRLLPYALRAHHQHLGVEGVWLPGLTALAAIAQPRLFQRSEMSVDVEVHGRLTRGMTVFDRRSHVAQRRNIDVLTEVESQGVLDYLGAIVARSMFNS